MRNDVITRLAAANPVPSEAPVQARPRVRRARLAVAVCRRGRNRDSGGNRRRGPDRHLERGHARAGRARLPLDQALQDLKVGSTMQ